MCGSGGVPSSSRCTTCAPCTPARSAPGANGGEPSTTRISAPRIASGSGSATAVPIRTRVRSARSRCPRRTSVVPETIGSPGPSAASTRSTSGRLIGSVVEVARADGQRRPGRELRLDHDHARAVGDRQDVADPEQRRPELRELLEVEQDRREADVLDLIAEIRRAEVVARVRETRPRQRRRRSPGRLRRSRAGAPAARSPPRRAGAAARGSTRRRRTRPGSAARARPGGRCRSSPPESRVGRSALRRNAFGPTW